MEVALRLLLALLVLAVPACTSRPCKSRCVAGPATLPRELGFMRPPEQAKRPPEETTEPSSALDENDDPPSTDDYLPVIVTVGSRKELSVAQEILKENLVPWRGIVQHGLVGVTVPERYWSQARKLLESHPELREYLVHREPDDVPSGAPSR